MKKGFLDETETHELAELQKEIPTVTVENELDSFKSIVETRFDSVKESQEIQFSIILKWLKVLT